MKRLAKNRKVPLVVSHQFNRAVKVNNPATARIENLGLSDVSGWNADAVFALVQTEDMRKDKQMIIKNLKQREGVGMEVEINWDFDTMNFSEIPPDADVSDGEFSTGVDDEVPF